MQPAPLDPTAGPRRQRPSRPRPPPPEAQTSALSASPRRPVDRPPADLQHHDLPRRRQSPQQVVKGFGRKPEGSRKIVPRHPCAGPRDSTRRRTSHHTPCSCTLSVTSWRGKTHDGYSVTHLASSSTSEVNIRNRLVFLVYRWLIAWWSHTPRRCQSVPRQSFCSRTFSTGPPHK